jgi:hypothetical protein
LHSYFQGFPWAEQDISDDFCTGGGDGKTYSLVLSGILCAHRALVDILEDFIETELSEALHRVSDQCW